MFGSTHIEDYFVLSSIHDYPLRVIQLEAYMDSLVKLLAESLEFIKDKNTKNFIRKEISNVEGSKENLGNSFFEEAKIKLGMPRDHSFWPKDFPTITILGSKETTVRFFDPREVGFFLDKKTEAEKILTHLCNTYNPILLIATPTIQMEIVLTSINPELVQLFERTWTGKEIDNSILDRMTPNIIQNGLRKFEIGVMDEAYRQLVITGVDLQRALRKRLYRYCSEGDGRVTLISEYVFLQLFECLYTIFAIDWLAHLMTELGLSILVLENEYMSVFVPTMSEHDALPFSNQLRERQRRLLYQYVSSKGTSEEKIPPFLFFVRSLSEFESTNLRFLMFLLQESDYKMICFPRKVANDLFGDSLKSSEPIVSEWIDGPKSPFVKVTWKGEEYCLSTNIILEDRLFGISWQVHKGKHFKIRGSRFEDFVLDVLQKRFPDAFTFKNKFFVATVDGKRKKYEIDRTFVIDDLFFLIECKNLMLLEDSSDLKKLRSRYQELKRYGKYLEQKANLLKDNFEQLETEIPKLKLRNCTRIVPVIISLYPDLVSFYKLPFLTIYEFIRYVSSSQRKRVFVPSFTDFSQTTFRFPSFTIKRANKNSKA